MSLAEETMLHSGAKPEAQHELSHSPSLGRNKGFQRCRNWFTEDVESRILSRSKKVRDTTDLLRKSKSTSHLEDQNTENEPLQILENPDMWCIYRVPRRLRNANEAAYDPQLLSIGPFHHGKPELKDMETHKRKYYDIFCTRTWKTMVGVKASQKKDELRTFITKRQQSILQCYAGLVEISVDLVDLIAVDACFVIELLLMNSGTENHDTDYILRSQWLRKAVEQELILFENQLPYSLLQDLYDFALPASYRKETQAHEPSIEGKQSSCGTPLGGHSIDMGVQDHPFLKLSCKFFEDYSNGRPVTNGVKLKHFTDLVRHFLCPEKEMTWLDSDPVPIKSVYDVRQLKAAGVKFRPITDTSSFLIKKDDEGYKHKFSLACFRNMNIKMTQFCVKYETECIIRNVMASEQFLHPDKPYVCNYFLLLDQLVDTLEDVNVLIDNGVIVNSLGSSKAVAKLINSLCEQIIEDNSCYFTICKQLNEHYKISQWNRNMATLKQVYFKDLWTGSSTILGLFVLVFSIIGTIKSLKS